MSGPTAGKRQQKDMFCVYGRYLIYISWTPAVIKGKANAAGDGVKIKKLSPKRELCPNSVWYKDVIKKIPAKNASEQAK